VKTESSIPSWSAEPNPNAEYAPSLPPDGLNLAPLPAIAVRQPDLQVKHPREGVEVGT
jgi:hypothetical protein